MKVGPKVDKHYITQLIVCKAVSTLGLQLVQGGYSVVSTSATQASALTLRYHKRKSQENNYILWFRHGSCRTCREPRLWMQERKNTEYPPCTEGNAKTENLKAETVH